MVKQITQIFEVAQILARADLEPRPSLQQDKQPTQPVRKSAKTTPHKQHPPPPKR